jgi:hypothetical protein
MLSGLQHGNATVESSSWVSSRLRVAFLVAHSARRGQSEKEYSVTVACIVSWKVLIV